MLIKPRIVDVNHKYPLLIYFGPNPSDQKVTKKWQFSLLDYFASTHNVFVAVIDTRGSKGYGVKFQTDPGHFRPGEAERADVLKVIEKLTLDEIVNPDKIALLGMVKKYLEKDQN